MKSLPENMEGKCNKHPSQPQGTLYVPLLIFVYVFIPLGGCDLLEGKDLALYPPGLSATEFK